MKDDDDDDDVFYNHNLVCSIKHKYLFVSSTALVKFSKAELTKDVDKVALYFRTMDGYTLVTLPCIVTPYRDSVDGTRDRVTYQKLVAR